MSTRAPEEWTAAERSRANIAAMALTAELLRSPRALTDADRATARVLGLGWALAPKLAPRFPAGVPLPDERQLIHDYYTPRIVCDAIARAVAPLLPALAGADGAVRALEPSAGIGRFPSAFAAHARSVPATGGRPSNTPLPPPSSARFPERAGVRRPVRALGGGQRR
ncbi:MAG: hypothetical protein IPG17_27775 [Sandaracinaceae bacterium]|nr:hypothetical protein [Sandaracinaceae bacterium]